jgi:hypothetical protein
VYLLLPFRVIAWEPMPQFRALLSHNLACPFTHCTAPLIVMLLLCRVIAWEPVPQFRALLSYNLARNRLSHHHYWRCSGVQAAVL